jgi:hypothetical protein
MVLVVAAMTQAIYPYLYDYLLIVNPMMLILLSARNVLLIVLFGWAVAAVIRLVRGAPVLEDEDESGAAPTNWPLQRADA